MACQASPF
uniref:BAH domain-containing protein n=1 Tax=Rhizophora mucronata TaxID=61149 RepID=A0A2P2MVH8_RHIMU